VSDKDEKPTPFGASHEILERREFPKGKGDATQTVTRIRDKTSGDVTDFREDRGRIVEERPVKPVQA